MLIFADHLKSYNESMMFVHYQKQYNIVEATRFNHLLFASFPIPFLKYHDKGAPGREALEAFAWLLAVIVRVHAEVYVLAYALLGGCTGIKMASQM